MKDEKTVIREFNEVVNMTASELESWLKSQQSADAGWSKEDESGESIGHDSGRKITSILKSNPKKDPKKYAEDQIQHMRKVVSYCKRHLAQEEAVNSQKSDEEVKKTKSYASLKNWGHDPLKKRHQRQDGGGNDEDVNGDDNVEEEKETDSDRCDDDDKDVGEKRERTRNDTGPNKKRETRQTRAAAKADDNGKDADGSSTRESSDGDTTASGKPKSKNSGKANRAPEPGETVSWNWGQGQPEGKVLDVKEDTAEITTKRGNKVSRKGNPDDPAVILDTGKSKAIKSSHEINET